MQIRLAFSLPFQKHSDFHIPVKSSISYLNYYTKQSGKQKSIVLFRPYIDFFPDGSFPSNLGSNQDDFSLPRPLVENDKAMNDWLKKDLIDRQNSDQNYKHMAVRFFL